MTPSKPGLDFPNVVNGRTRGGGFGKVSYPVWQGIVGVFEVGALGAAGSVCDCSVLGMAEDLKHCELKAGAKAELPCGLGGATCVYVWGMCARRTGKSRYKRG